MVAAVPKRKPTTTDRDHHGRGRSGQKYCAPPPRNAAGPGDHSVHIRCSVAFTITQRGS
jgi:hypothetical protein